MGNTINVKLKEETEMFEITEKLIRDFQYHINLADRSMVSFARSIDSMRASCTILSKDKEESVGTDVSDGKRLIGEPEAALLLETIDEVVADHKFIAMESVNSLFTFLINMGSIYFTSESETTLSVDKYRQQNSALTDMNMRYCDSRIESLQSKIKTLGADHEYLKENLNNYNEREILYQREKNILKNNIKDLENDLSKTKSEKEDAIKQIGDIEQKNEELVKEVMLLKFKGEKMANEIRAEKSRREQTEEETKIEMKKCEEKIETLDQQLRERTSTVDEIHNENTAKMSKIEKMETKLKSLQEENTKVRSDLSDERKNNVSLKEENISINMLSDEVKKMNTTLKEMYEKEIRRLTECLQIETEAKVECEKKVDDLKSEQHQNDEKKSLEKKWNLIEDENRKLTLEINAAESMVESLKQNHKDEIDRHVIKFEKLKNVKKEHEKKIDEMNRDLNNVNMTNMGLISRLQKEIDTRVSIMEEKTAIINSLNDEIGNMKTKFEEIKKLNEKEHGRLIELLEQEKAKEEDYLKQLRQLKEKQNKDSDDVIQLHADKTSLIKVVEEKQKQIDALELNLELTTKTMIHVQVCYTDGFRAAKEEKELKKLLETRMEAECIELKFLNCSQKFAPLSTDLPSLIVCSRPAKTTRDKYISNVLEWVKVNPKTALLIFHEKDEKAFRKDMESVKETAQPSKIAGVFDIGYKNEIYKSEINSKSVERLLNFIDKEGVRKSRITESAV